MPSETPARFVVGAGVWLEAALAAWDEAAPGSSLHRVDVGQDANYGFDVSTLPEAPVDGAQAFVAWGPQFLNFRRLELMGELKRRGFKMPPLVCRGAIVSLTASVGENTLIGAGAIVAAGVRIGINGYLGAGVGLGHASEIGNSAWLADGVQIGHRVRIGAHTTLGRGVVVDDEIEIGKQCIIERPGRRTAPLAAKTFVMPPYAVDVVIVDGDTR